MSLPHLVIFSNFAMYIKTFDKMFNVIFHDVTYHAFELKFHSKTEK